MKLSNIFRNLVLVIDEHSKPKVYIMTTSKPCFPWGPNLPGGPNLGGQISWETVSKYAYQNEHNNLYSVQYIFYKTNPHII